MQVDTVGGWDHAMMITGFAMDGTFKTYEYCAHSRWRKDYSYGMTDAGVRGITRLIRLPDAPLIKQVSFWAGSVSSASALNWLYRKKWANLSANKHAGAGRLVVEVLFDAGMKANVVPTVQLTIPSTGTTSNTLNFLPDSAGDFNEFGWYIGAVTGNAKPYRTWRGYINALPSGRNVIGAVSIKAYGADGSATDSSNLLDEYSPGAVSMFYAIKIDTRKSSGQAK